MWKPESEVSKLWLSSSMLPRMTASARLNAPGSTPPAPGRSVDSSSRMPSPRNPVSRMKSHPRQITAFSSTGRPHFGQIKSSASEQDELRHIDAELLVLLVDVLAVLVDAALQVGVVDLEVRRHGLEGGAL